MLRNYFIIAFRNLLKNRTYSFINIVGLSVGMAVALIIGLLIHDELTYNQYHKHYEDLAQVMQYQTFNGKVGSQVAIPRPLEKALRQDFPEDFKYLSMASWTFNHILSYEDKKVSRDGNFMQVDFPEMLSLRMLEGTRYGLKNPNSILLSESSAKILFGNENALDKVIKLDNRNTVKVTGVYEDLPYNTRFKELEFISSWDLYVSDQEWVKNAATQWGNNSFQLFVQINAQSDMETISKKIEKVKVKYAKDEEQFDPRMFLHPMERWHLYGEFKDGKNVGGRIQYVWLFGIIGVFVLLLACINFMNLSTARSERRAKEVGVRKVLGSLKQQLITQFLSESIFTAFLAFILAIILTGLSLGFFNEIADKKLRVLWSDPVFWLIGLGFTLLTGLISGSYPAFYLSAFNPVRVLKGTFKAGKYSTLPRKALVVLQFSVSITLIIGTIIVYHQIQHTKNRPIGYDKEGVITIFMQSEDYRGKLDIIENELKKVNAIQSISQSSGPITGIWSNNGGYEWKGKDPKKQGEFATVWVTHDHGKTIAWELKEGRDFSKEFSTDSNAVIVNEAAVEFIGVEDPIGMEISRDKKEKFKVIGVVKNIIKESPYEPVRQMLYFLSYENVSWINLKLNPEKRRSECIAAIEKVLTTLIPAAPFEYKFVDEQYAEKFEAEERIGTLAGFFSSLAILISVLGLFGLASFMAEKRAKEIGIRKVLGASMLSLWQLLSKEFVSLVFISSLVASPIAYFLLNNWLENYSYRISISAIVFLIAIFGAFIITLLTVSYQALKAASLNPVEVLKNE